MSAAITRLLELSGGLGLQAEEGQWSNMYDFFFDAPMPEDVRAIGLADEKLRYFTSERTPHNRSDEGFIDDEAKIAISFAKAA